MHSSTNGNNLPKIEQHLQKMPFNHQIDDIKHSFRETSEILEVPINKYTEVAFGNAIIPSDHHKNQLNSKKSIEIIENVPSKKPEEELELNNKKYCSNIKNNDNEVFENQTSAIFEGDFIKSEFVLKNSGSINCIKSHSPQISSSSRDHISTPKNNTGTKFKKPNTKLMAKINISNSPVQDKIDKILQNSIKLEKESQKSGLKHSKRVSSGSSLKKGSNSRSISQTKFSTLDLNNGDELETSYCKTYNNKEKKILNESAMSKERMQSDIYLRNIKNTG